MIFDFNITRNTRIISIDFITTNLQIDMTIIIINATSITYQINFVIILYLVWHVTL